MKIGRGEQELLHRTAFAAKNLGWYYYKVTPDALYLFTPYTKFLYFYIEKIVNKIIKPDFSFVTSIHGQTTAFFPSYLYVNIPLSLLEEKLFKKHAESWKLFNGYVDMNNYQDKAGTDSDELKHFLDNEGKKDYFIIKGLLATHQLKYKHAEPKKMLITGSLWGKGRGDDKIKKFSIKA